MTRIHGPGRARRRRTLPGFGLTLGITSTYLGLMVILPLAALALKSASLSPSEFWRTVTSSRALASYRLSLGTSLAAALTNCVLGFVVAWVTVRYRFLGRRALDALVDLPFALPTAVSGIALTTVYADTGWLGRILEPLGVQVVFTPIGITICLIFVGFPFTVRSLQPAIEDIEREVEEAAASLGAGRLQTFRRVIFPSVLPAMIAGFALSFARALGEYGSVVFIAGNMPGETEITPLLVVIQLEQYQYGGAAAISVVLLAASFGLLLAINGLQARSLRHHRWEAA